MTTAGNRWCLNGSLRIISGFLLSPAPNCRLLQLSCAAHDRRKRAESRRLRRYRPAMADIDFPEDYKAARGFFGWSRCPGRHADCRVLRNRYAFGKPCLRWGVWPSDNRNSTTSSPFFSSYRSGRPTALRFTQITAFALLKICEIDGLAIEYQCTARFLKMQAGVTAGW